MGGGLGMRLNDSLSAQHRTFSDHYFRFRHRTAVPLAAVAGLTVLAMAAAAPLLWVDKIGVFKSNTALVHFAVAVAYMLLVLLTVIFVLQRSFRGEVFGRRLMDRLSYHAFPDGGHFTHRIALKSRRYRWLFVMQLSCIPKDEHEVMIIAPQISHKNRTYDVGSIRTQFDALKEHMKSRAQGMDALKWVCFTTRNGKFAGYQPYHVFYNEVVAKGADITIKVLNTVDTKQFEAAVRELASTELASMFPYNALRETWSDSVGEGISNREALRQMLNSPDEYKDHTMLVSADQKPVGILTLRGLVRRLFAGLLEDGKAATPPTSDATSDDDHTAAPEEDFSTAYEAEVDNDTPATAQAGSPSAADQAAQSSVAEPV